jgi:hypothetical protein
MGKLSHKKYRGHLRIVFGLSGVIDTAEAKIGYSQSNIFANSIYAIAICKKALTLVSRA